MKSLFSKKSIIKMSLMLALFGFIVAACQFAPSGKTVTPGDEELDVSWALPTNNLADHFVASATAPSDVGPYTCTATTTETGCTITGLTNGTEYEVDVISVVWNPSLVPPAFVDVPHATESTVFATPVGAPDAPTGLSLTPDETSIDTEWIAPVDDGGSAITGYTASATAPSDPGPYTCTAGPTETDCTISGLTHSTEYTVTVIASNAIGDSPVVTGDATTLTPPPPTTTTTQTPTTTTTETPTTTQTPTTQTPTTQTPTTQPPTTQDPNSGVISDGQQAPESLAYTGANTTLLLAIGASLLLIGLAGTRVAARRR